MNDDEKVAASLCELLVNLGTDAFLVVDAGETIVSANAGTVAMFGWTLDELVGSSIHRLLPERHRATHEQRCRRFAVEPTMRRMGSAKALELVGLRKDGTEFPVDVGLNPVTTEDGVLVLASVRDVTDRVRAVEALTRSERMLRDFFEMAEDAIFVADRDGRFTEVNAAACRMCGRERDELLGMTIAGLTPPEDLPRLAETHAHLLAGGVETGEWVAVRKDGSRLPVQITAKILADGRWQAFVRDISERKRAEVERVQAMAELQAVLDQCPVGITFARGARPQTFERNRAAQAMLGPHADGFGRLHLDNEQVAREQFPVLRALRGESVVRAEYVFDRGDTKLPIEVSAAPVRDAEGKVSGAVAVWRDLSPERELERLRAEWSSVVAHDLRQPINSIYLYAQLLDRLGSDGPEDARRYIGEIRKLVGRVTRMTSDLSDLSRLDSSRLQLEVRELDLAVLVRDLGARARLESPDRELVVGIEGEGHHVLGDSDRLVQVLENLLSNAVKYGKPKTPIRLRLARHEHQVIVEITNLGAGISAKDLAVIFGRFRRAGVAAHKAVPGVGLGLHIAQGLVEAHGGTLVAESVPGAETTFRVTLPHVVAKGSPCDGIGASA